MEYYNKQNIGNLAKRILLANISIQDTNKAQTGLNKMLDNPTYAAEVCFDSQYKTLGAMFLFNRTDEGALFWFKVAREVDK